MIEAVPCYEYVEEVDDYPNQPELDPKLVGWTRLSEAIAHTRKLRVVPLQENKDFKDQEWYL